MAGGRGLRPVVWAQIQPGDPFTYTAKTVADSPEGGGQSCVPGTNSQTAPYTSFPFTRVSPGDDLFTENSVGTALLTSDYSNTETFLYTCPALRFTTGPMVIPVAGDQTEALAPGCYQSTIWENSLYFPDGGPSGLQPPLDSLSGTVGTLKVGNGPECVTVGVSLASNKPISFGTTSGSVKLSCKANEKCVGKATVIKPRGNCKHCGKVVQARGGRCSHCKLAVGHYSTPPGKTEPVKLRLTKAGKAALRGGKCLRCRLPIARTGNHRFKAQLVLTSATNGAKSTLPVRMGPSCKKC